MITEVLRYFLIALAGSATLIVLSNIILQSLIRRPADYYGAYEVQEPTSPEAKDTEKEKTPEQVKEPEPAPAVSTAISWESASAAAESSGNTVFAGYEESDEAPEQIVEQYDTEEVTAEEPQTAAEPPVTEVPETEPEPVTEPEETIEDIRRSLEDAYRKQLEEQTAETSETDEVPSASEPSASDKKTPEKTPRKKKGKSGKSSGKKSSRKPSMNMKKAELVEIATSMGIEVKEKDTKRIILDKIYEVRNK